MDVANVAELALIDQLLQLLEGGVKPQHMADHEDAARLARLVDGPLGVLHRQRDRLFHQHILAGANGLYGKLGVKLRRKSNDDRIDVGIVEQMLGIYRAASLLDGKTFSTRKIGVRYSTQGTQRFERPNMVRPPIPAPKDSNPRLHSIIARFNYRETYARRPPNSSPRNDKVL